MGIRGVKRPWRLGVLFLPAKEQLEIFYSTQHQHDERTNGAHYKHAFQNSYEYYDEEHTHKLSMLLETARVDQFEMGWHGGAAGGRHRLCLFFSLFCLSLSSLRLLPTSL